MSSAVKVLTGHQRLRLVLQRVGRVPGVRYTNGKTTWVDLIHRRMVVVDGGVSLSDGLSDGALCRTVHLQTSVSQRCLGLNIRGGIEYGLGIYVSKLDPGGLAEQSGIKMGDQILSANGVSFQEITHSRAVAVLKSQSNVSLMIKEAGRYPAYQELVAEYSWLEDRSSPHHSSSRGSDSSSSASSMSSGTPLNSVAGLSQATLPLSLPFSSQTGDASSWTEDLSFRVDDLVETSLSRGQTELLHDSAIRGAEEEAREDGKMSVLMNLSRSGPSACRTQSHMTVSEEQQRKKQGGGGISLQRSRTFLSLFRRRSSSRGRSKSPALFEPGQGTSSRSSRCDQAALPQVEDMARKLLQDEDVAVVLELCKRLVADGEVKSLVRPLLAVLDTPEKLLLLREVRRLVCEEDLQQFNSMVQPFEEEAYDVLKRRSRRSSSLHSPRAGHAPEPHLITPVPGNELKPKHLLLQLECLSVTSDPAPALSPLPDVPVDGPSQSEPPKPSTMPNWLLTESSTSSAAPETRRSRAKVITGLSESRAQRNKMEKQDGFHTVTKTFCSWSTPLSQVFGPLRRSQSSAAPSVGPQEYELQAISTS